VILVTTGTNGSAFDRLLSQLDDLAANEEVVVQHGPSSLRPRGARCLDYVAYESLSQLIEDARVVVTHGGVGSVLAALSRGHRPLVVPRRRDSGEAIDDHQVSFAQRLAEEELITLVEDPREIRDLVETDTRRPQSAGAGGGRLRSELSAYLRAR
jgi:beta-1,4-N-acetylglucosaminyltransferase